MRHIGFNEILKDYLDNNTISNKEFASRIGITPKHLIDILSGKSELTLPVIESISIVTNIPMNNIIEIEKNYHMEENINSFSLNIFLLAESRIYFTISLIFSFLYSFTSCSCDIL